MGDGSGTPRRARNHILEGKTLGGSARAFPTLHRTGGRGDNRRAFARAPWIGSKRPGTRHPSGIGATPAWVAMRVTGIPACCSRIRGGRARSARDFGGVRFVSRGGATWFVATSGLLGVRKE